MIMPLTSSHPSRERSSCPTGTMVLTHRPKTTKAQAVSHGGSDKRRKVCPSSSSNPRKSDKKSKRDKTHEPTETTAVVPPVYNYENDTASLTDSVKDHIYENGLRYHGYRPGSYSFPNDDTEQERDRWAHRLSIEICGGFFLAPVETRLEKGAHVLDLGEYNVPEGREHRCGF